MHHIVPYHWKRKSDSGQHRFDLARFEDATALAKAHGGTARQVTPPPSEALAIAAE